MADDWPFVDSTRVPSEAEVRDTLGAASVAFDRIVDLTKAFAHEWRCMPRSGWALKVGDRKKALLYVTPLRGALRVSLTVRESEREILLGEPGLTDVREELLASRKYIEGFALRFDISDEQASHRVEALLSRIMALRT